MRIMIPLVIEMSDEQVSAYGVKTGLGNKPRAKDMVDRVRANTLAAVSEYPLFAALPNGSKGADVSIKGR